MNAPARPVTPAPTTPTKTRPDPTPAVAAHLTRDVRAACIPASESPTPMIPAYSRSAGLPDPDLHAEFYADVPLKRLLAFIVDSILIVVITVLLIPLMLLLVAS